MRTHNQHNVLLNSPDETMISNNISTNDSQLKSNELVLNIQTNDETNESDQMITLLSNTQNVIIGICNE